MDPVIIPAPTDPNHCQRVDQLVNYLRGNGLDLFRENGSRYIAATYMLTPYQRRLAMHLVLQNNMFSPEDQEFIRNLWKRPLPDLKPEADTKPEPDEPEESDEI
jgi:hypothetical protein